MSCGFPWGFPLTPHPLDMVQITALQEDLEENLVFLQANPGLAQKCPNQNYVAEVWHPCLSEVRLREIKLKFIFSTLFLLLSLWKLKPCKAGFYRRTRDWRGKAIARYSAESAPGSAFKLLKRMSRKVEMRSSAERARASECVCAVLDHRGYISNLSLIRQLSVQRFDFPQGLGSSARSSIQKTCWNWTCAGTALWAGQLPLLTHDVLSQQDPQAGCAPWWGGTVRKGAFVAGPERQVGPRTQHQQSHTRGFSWLGRLPTAVELPGYG